MAKKNRKTKNDKPAENPSAASNADLTEATQGESTAVESAGGTSELSTDDLLDDVRRSLIEAEAESDEKKAGWWKRGGRSRKKAQTDEAEPSKAADEFEAVVEPEAATGMEPDKQDEYVEQIDELIDMLDSDAAVSGVEPALETVVAPPAEPEPAIDVEELKKRVF